jgi:hypothetical protein
MRGPGLPLKAVVCLRAYKKLEGLHDLTVLVATLDSASGGVQGRLDASGVSLANAQRLAQHYLDGFAWTAPKTGLALIECFERDGRTARVLDVWQWPVTLGRAMDNDIVLDDPFVAAHHARLEALPEGGLRLQVLHTANGVRVDGQLHGAGASVPLPAQGATLQIGNSPLRLRLPSETLAPERPLPNHGSAWMPLALGALLYASVVIRHGIGLDPGAEVSAWLPAVLGLPALVACWCAVWALMSKLFRHRFDFAGHLRIVLPWLIALEAGELICQQLARASAGPGCGAWPRRWRWCCWPS